MIKKITLILLAQCICVGLFAQTNFDYELEKAKRGDAEAQYNVGGCYYNGKGVSQDYYEAVNWYKLAAEQGYAAAQNMVGMCYWHGRGVSQSYSKAFEWYMKAAEQGYVVAQNNLGNCYDWGRGVSQDYSKAFEWYMKAAEQGNEEAQNNVGYCYYNGEGVSQDYSEAFKWYMKAAEKGNIVAQYNVGYCYWEGVSKDYSKAFEWFMKAAEKGSASAQDKVGDCYYDGKGVSQDYSEAVKWYMKAAEQGNEKAQNKVGDCYYNGKGVSQDYYEAAKWYKLAANQGNDAATKYKKVGDCYYFSQDYSEAFKWYMNAANKRDAKAQITVGDCYYYGVGVSQDYSEAFEWYMNAAEKGSASAQYNVGYCYKYGKGVRRKHSEAKRWFNKAARNGYTGPKTVLRGIPDNARSGLQNISKNVSTHNNTSITYNPSAPPAIDFIPNSIQFVDANGNNAIDAEEKCTISVQVTNSGKGDAVRCVAKITAESKVPGVTYSNVDIPQIKAGETRMVEIPLTANMQTENGIAKFSIQIDEPNGFGTDAVTLSVNTRAFVAPMIKVVDYATVSADGSSVLAKKSAFDLQLLLQNVEAGKAENVKVSIEVPENVFLMETQGQQSFGSMDGGEVKKITYSLIANNNYAGTSIPLKIKVEEKYGKYAESRTIDLPLNQTIRNHNIVIEETGGERNSVIQIASISSEVDKDIPISNAKNDKTFAVIIANESYNKEANVPYAMNDGNVFSEYCMNTLGMPSSNIHLVKNATLNDIRHEVNWVTNVMDASGGDAKVVFYYAGHGIPDERTRTAYLLPVDGYGSDVTTGYSLADLYSALGNSPSQSVTVFLDACFSGTKRDGDMLASARGVAIKVADTNPVGNMVVFSASQGDETAYPYAEKAHGMFTYYLLKKLQDTKGEVTLGELSDYVIQQVKLQSVVTNSNPQTPTVIPSQAVLATWRNETLK